MLWCGAAGGCAAGLQLPGLTLPLALAGAGSLGWRWRCWHAQAVPSVAALLLEVQPGGVSTAPLVLLPALRLTCCSLLCPQQVTCLPSSGRLAVLTHRCCCCCCALQMFNGTPLHGRNISVKLDDFVQQAAGLGEPKQEQEQQEQ